MPGRSAVAVRLGWAARGLPGGPGRLEADLLECARSSPVVTRALEARYETEKAAERTAERFVGWTQLLATQVVVAWILSCVFVRTLEDRGLRKQARLAGPGAEDSQRQFFQLAPSLTERDYLLMVFRELAHHPAVRNLFDERHSPVWTLSPSSSAAQELLALFRTPNATAPASGFGQSATRFLGDLYQDLSEDVRKRYALLQTPDFIESFILDWTLDSTIQRFGFDDTTLIDPTCASGHFLLGASSDIISDTYGLRLWTFGGGSANNLLAQCLEEHLGEKLVVDSPCDAFRGQAAASEAAIKGAIAALRRAGRPNYADALRLANNYARRRLSKCQRCLPPRLQSAFLAKVLTDPEAARLAIAGTEPCR